MTFHLHGLFRLALLQEKSPVMTRPAIPPIRPHTQRQQAVPGNAHEFPHQRRRYVFQHLFLSIALLAATVLFPYHNMAAQPVPETGEAPIHSASSPTDPDGLLQYPLGSVGLPLEGPLVLNGASFGAHSVRTADFDGDGDEDVLSAARNDGQILWYRNSGGIEPSFETLSIAVIPGSYLAFPTDLNQDGHIDVVVAAVTDLNPSTAEESATPDEPALPQGTGRLILLQNDGQATPNFTSRAIAEGLNYPVSATTADLDRDGDPDLVLATRDDNSVTWFASSGGSAPTFTPRVITSEAMAAVSVDVGDMDRDGDVDIISASEDDDRILLHSNDGQGNFASTVVRPGTPRPDFDYAKSVHAVDLDGDGDLDIAYASEDQNEVGWYTNNGAQPPQFTQQVIASGVADHVKIIASADMDNDGDPDLLSAWSGLFGQRAAVLWHRNDGASSPTFASYAVTTSAIGARYVHAADLDGDGDKDLLVASRDDGRVTWFRNRLPHRTAQVPASALRTLGVYTSARHITAADLDGDGDRDLLSSADRAFVWHENSGEKPATFTAHAIASSINGGRWAEAGDLDHDGDLDLMLASTKNGSVFWYENNGARPPVFTEHVAASGLGGPRALAIADIDRDGDLDAVIPSDDDHRVVWLENNGARPPVFTLRVIDSTSPADGYFRTVSIADMDRDGDPDVVAASANGDQVIIYFNQGNRPATFSKQVIGGADYPLHVHAADVDGDGDLDVLVASEIDGDISLFENTDGHAGSFAKRIIDNDAPTAHAVASGDIDSDGDMDVVGAIEGNNTFVWYENDGAQPPAFTKRVIYDLALIAHSIGVTDIDNDGDLDVMGTARETGLVAWFENRGGNYSLNETGFARVTAGDRILAATALAAKHNGRTGDAAVQIATLDVHFTDGADHVLTTDELVSRARSVSAYADANGNGVFDPNIDRLLVTESQLSQASAGRLLLPLSTAQPPANVNATGTETFFVVAELNGACSADATVQPVILPTSKTAVDALAGAPLRAEFETSGGTAIEIDPQRQLRINEISAYSFINGYEVDDWIEIYNPGPLPVDMGGMYITDDTTEPTKFRLPPSLVLPVGGFLVLIADDDGDALHTNFKLSRNGETLGLFDSNLRLNRPLDIVTFGEQAANTTSGRWPDGEDTWRTLPTPSKGSLNVLGGLSPGIYLPAISKSSGC